MLLSAFSETRDRILHMKQQEATTYQRNAPYSVNDSHNSRTEEFQGFRHIVVSWMYQMAEIFHLQDSVVYVASYYLDKTVEYEKDSHFIIQTPKDYQLASLTCLHLAMKLMERQVFPMVQLLQLGQGAFVEKDVIQMERNVITALQWRMYPPTPNCFLEEFLTLLLDIVDTDTENDEQEQQERTSSSFSTQTTIQVLRQLSRHLIRTAVPRHEFATVSPSILAYSSIMLAMERHRLPLHQFLSFINRIQSVAGLTSTSSGLRHAFDLLEPLVAVDHHQHRHHPQDGVSSVSTSTTTTLDQTDQRRDDQNSPILSRKRTILIKADSPRNVIV
jgi:hypothetical protein